MISRFHQLNKLAVLAVRSIKSVKNNCVLCRMHIDAIGCHWKALSKKLLPRSIVHFDLMLWDWDGMLERVHEATYVATREPDRDDHRLPKWCLFE